MVEADFSGSFLSKDNAADNDIIVITGKPTIEEKEGEYGKYAVTNMDVEINGKKKTYSPSKESGNKMVASWGKEMDSWVGEKATVKHVLKQVKGKTETVIECYPLEDKKVYAKDAERKSRKKMETSVIFV